MFFLAYIILPILILGNLILIGMGLQNKKVHILTALICVALPLVALYVQHYLFPPTRKEGFIVLIRYPEYILVQTVLNAIIFMILKLSNTHEKNPRRNYYRDKEDPLEDNKDSQLLDD